MAKEKFARISGMVYDIKNDFFGHTIDVAGLVTGGDLIAQLKGKELGQRLLIPANMLRHGEGVFLDDVTLQQASEALGVPIYPTEQDGGALCDAMLGILPELQPFEKTDEDEYYRYNPKKQE
jgi:NifB/MoaA-like Fe-S oxidoreductase